MLLLVAGFSGTVTAGEVAACLSGAGVEFGSNGQRYDFADVRAMFGRVWLAPGLELLSLSRMNASYEYSVLPNDTASGGQWQSATSRLGFNSWLPIRLSWVPLAHIVPAGRGDARSLRQYLQLYGSYSRWGQLALDNGWARMTGIFGPAQLWEIGLSYTFQVALFPLTAKAGWLSFHVPETEYVPTAGAEFRRVRLAAYDRTTTYAAISLGFGNWQATEPAGVQNRFAAAPLLRGPSADAIMTRRCRAVRTIQDCENFLRDYPNSQYAAEIAGKLERLYFDRAVQANTAAAFKEFLDRYPNGPYSEDARRRKEELVITLTKKPPWLLMPDDLDAGLAPRLDQYVLPTLAVGDFVEGYRFQSTDRSAPLVFGLVTEQDSVRVVYWSGKGAITNVSQAERVNLPLPR